MTIQEIFALVGKINTLKLQGNAMVEKGGDNQ